MLDESKLGQLLDDIYAGDIGRQWTAEVSRGRDEFIASCINRFARFSQSLNLLNNSIELFEGTEVLPEGFAKEYELLMDQTIHSALPNFWCSFPFMNFGGLRRRDEFGGIPTTSFRLRMFHTPMRGLLRVRGLERTLESGVNEATNEQRNHHRLWRGAGEDRGPAGGARAAAETGVDRGRTATVLAARAQRAKTQAYYRPSSGEKSPPPPLRRPRSTGTEWLRHRATGTDAGEYHTVPVRPACYRSYRWILGYSLRPWFVTQGGVEGRQPQAMTSCR